MGDGSWRLTGLRTSIGGSVQQVNTFIERAGSLVGVVDVIVPAEAGVSPSFRPASTHYDQPDRIA
jgi:hypothetical protein